MPALKELELTDRLACQGAHSVYGVLRADSLISARDVQAVDDQESMTFSFSKLDETGSIRPFASFLRAGRVLTCVYEDDSFDEWRIGTVVRGRSEKGVITVTCVPLWLDLVERCTSTAGAGWVSDMSAGVRRFDYALTQRTPASILSTYVIPNCPSWVTLGTVDPTYVIPTLPVSRLTPGALVLAVRDALRAVDIACEVRLRRNGTTDYKLDLVTQIGASANVPVFHPAVSLETLREEANPTTQATRALMKGGTTPDGEVGQWGIARFRGGAPSGNVIALTDRNGGAGPIAFDNQFVGNYLLRVKTGRTFPITASNAAAGTVTLSSVSTIAADEDFEIRLDEPLTNTRSTVTRYAVSSVPDGTHITLGVSAPIIANGQYTDWYAKVWSAAVAGTVIATTRISGSVAATDVIAVASSAGVNNTHYVEFVQLDGAGEIPAFVDHPTYVQADPIGYGVKVMEVTRAAVGVTQICPNAWMRAWSNPANPPDGYTLIGGGVSSREATITRYGGYAWRLNSSVGDPQAASPILYPDSTSAQTRISARALVWFVTFPFIDGAPADLALFALKADGSLGVRLGQQKVSPLASNVGNPEVDVGVWVELKIEGVTLATAGDPATVACAPYGVQAIFTPRVRGNTNTYEAVLDILEVYPFATCPNLPVEFGDAVALLQAGNNKLREVATPPLFYQFGVRDLERAFREEFPRLALTLGGDVRAADIEDGIDATVRLLRMDRDLLHSTDTQLTLANRPTRSTTMQVASTSQQARVVSVLQQGAALSAASVPFVVLTSSTTLPQNAEIAIPSAGAPSVALGQDTAVTYHPAVSTDPKTSVTVGLPPSRLPSLPLVSL